jgi:prepilin-type N-terminal cleavage/methylation domain-containing protein
MSSLRSQHEARSTKHEAGDVAGRPALIRFVLRAPCVVPREAHRGFTLIELLLALTLVAVIGGGMALALSTSLRAAETIQHRTDVADERRTLVAQLQADLQGVWVRPGSQTTWFRGGDAATISAGYPPERSEGRVPAAPSPGGATAAQGDVLELTTARPVSTDALQAGDQAEGALGPQSDVAQVSWRLEPDTDGSLALVRRERTPADPEVDDTQDPSVVRTVFSRSVTGLQVLFFDGTQWLEEWDAVAPEQNSSSDSGNGQSSPAGLPQAVQVTLTLAPDATRRRSVPRNQPSDAASQLTTVVAMPGAEGQTAATVGTSG